MNKKYFSILIISCVLVFLSGCSQKSLTTIFKEQSKQQGVNYKTLMAICNKESNFNPYVVNVNKSIFNVQKGSHSFDSKIGANIYMDMVLDPLGLNYDIGICQINKIHLKRFKVDNEDLLDKETNIKIASKIYNWNVRKCKGNIVCALSMYNTGYKNSKIGKKYAKHVLKIRKKMFGY